MHYAPGMDTNVMLWNYQPPHPAQRKPGELLFEFVSAIDGAHVM